MSKTKRAVPFQFVVGPTNSQITDEQRHKMVAEAAYYLALQRGFSDDTTPEQDWYLAEAQIERELARGTRAAK